MFITTTRAYTSAFLKIKSLKGHLHKLKYEKGIILIISSISEKVEKTQLYDTNSSYLWKVCPLAIITAPNHFSCFQ